MPRKTRQCCSDYFRIAKINETRRRKKAVGYVNLFCKLRTSAKIKSKHFAIQIPGAITPQTPVCLQNGRFYRDTTLSAFSFNIY